MSTMPPHAGHLITLGERFAIHTNRLLSTVSNLITGGGRFFSRFGTTPKASCTLRTYERVVGWFDANWPADVPRPKHKKDAA